MLFTDTVAGKFAFAVALCLVLAFVEHHRPAQSRQTLSGRLRNIFYTGLGLALGAIATRAVYEFIPGRLRQFPEQGFLFSLIIALAYALLTDFLFYWYHRAEHTWSFLWAIHQLHHSDTELNATTTMRTYWLETPLQALCIGIPVGTILGLDHTAAAILSIGLTSWFFFTHANLRLHLGILTPLFCGPQIHRIHHSQLPEHRDRNFAQFFPFIDAIFGTYYAPSPDEFPPTGTPELASDTPIARVMARPFRLWLTQVEELVSG